MLFPVASLMSGVLSQKPSWRLLCFLLRVCFPTMTNIHPDSFRGSVKPLLILGAVCGLLPVKGIFGASFRFTWVNAAHLYALFISSVTLFFDACYTVDSLPEGIRIDGLAATVFYSVCLLTTFFFLQIARNFASISEDFAKVESKMADYGYPKGLGMKTKMLLFSFMLLAFVEHGTMAYMNFHRAWKESSNGDIGFLHSFYVIHFPSISLRLSYSGIGTIVLFWVNCMCTFNWNYLDFFLMGMSLQISSRFGQINRNLKDFNRSVLPSKVDREFWEVTCSNYNSISRLTKKLDKHLSNIIVTSFFSNMYHLSLQLVRTLKISGTLFQMTYFYFSLGFLIARLMSVLFFAARINEESKKPAHVLFSLDNPPAEAIRFLHQVLTDEIALTGNGFFVITRKFVVSVIGTIVTYQVVLLQFSSLKEV